MAHPYRRQADQSEARRAAATGVKTRDVSAAEILTGKAPTPRPEKHSIAVPGGKVHLERRFASGGAVRDVSITLRRDDGAEQRLKFKDGGLVMKGSKAKLHGPKVY